LYQYAALTATAMNGAACSEDGVVLDGVDDFLDATPWEFGGEPLTVEAYVKFESFGYYSAIFNFNDGKWNNQVSLSNHQTDGFPTFMK